MTYEEKEAFKKEIYYSQKDIFRICKIIWEHPINWTYIADILETAIPLIDYMGPDGVLLAIIREKEMRQLYDESNR